MFNTGSRAQLAHRVAWYLEYGRWPVPCGLHKCDNTRGVRVTHLFEGTRAENQTDMAKKGRSPHGDAHYFRRHPESVPRGDKNGQAKLTEAQALEALRRKRSGELHRVIAADLGVSRSHVSAIGTRDWRHLLVQDGQQ